MVTDTSATKPEDWLENEPESIPDPEAEKPEEWDVSLRAFPFPLSHSPSCRLRVPKNPC